MELIMNLIALGVATLKILFAIPVLGALVLLSGKPSRTLKAHFRSTGIR